jgi:hypothetical protein
LRRPPRETLAAFGVSGSDDFFSLIAIARRRIAGNFARNESRRVMGLVCAPFAMAPLQ